MPAVGSSRNQYGWLKGVLAGNLNSKDREIIRLVSSVKSFINRNSGSPANFIPSQRTGNAELMPALKLRFKPSPGTVSACGTVVATERPRHSRKTLSSCFRLKFASGLSRNAGRFFFTASNASTLADGLFVSNCAMISSVCLPISAPPGTRDQVVSMPSMMSFVAGSPSRTIKLEVRAPPPPPKPPKFPKPWLLCMARLREAISP